MSFMVSPKSRLFDVKEGMVCLDDLSRRLRNDPESEFEEPLGQALILGATKKTVSILRARNQPTSRLTTLRTETGHRLSTGTETQVLVWQDSGLIAWTPINQLERGQTVVLRKGMWLEGQNFPYTQGVMKSGFKFDLTEKMFFFLGLVCTAVCRDHRWCLLTSSPVQVSRVEQMAKEIGLTNFFKAATKFSRFSGIYQLDAGIPVEIVCWAKSHAFLRLVRKAPIALQKAWAAGLTLQGGRWTVDALELEMERLEILDTLFSVLQNIGIRSNLFETLNVYGHRRIKLSIDRESDRLLADNMLWKEYKKSCTWQDRVCCPDEPPGPLKNLLEGIGLAVPGFAPTGLDDLRNVSTEQFPELVESEFWDTVQWVVRPDVAFDTIQDLERDQKTRSVSLVVPVGFDCLVDFMFVRWVQQEQ